MVGCVTRRIPRGKCTKINVITSSVRKIKIHLHFFNFQLDLVDIELAMTSTVLSQQPQEPTMGQEQLQEAITLVEEAKLLQRRKGTTNGKKGCTSSSTREDSRDPKSLYQTALLIQEGAVGFWHEDTASTYYEMGWLEYNSKRYLRALTYLLQSLRISNHLHGDDHASTICLMDDIRDLLVEDLRLDIEFGNEIFESWTLQEEAAERLDLNDRKGALELYQRALRLIPAPMELERAHVHCQLAPILATRHKSQEALCHYYAALRILPKWLSKDHPRVRAAQKASQEVSKAMAPTISNHQYQRCRTVMEASTFWWGTSSTNQAKVIASE